MTTYMNKLAPRMYEPHDCAVCGEAFPFRTMTTMESGHEVCEGCVPGHTYALEEGDETFYYLSEEY